MATSAPNNIYERSRKERSQRAWRLTKVVMRQFRVFLICSVGAFLISAILLFTYYPVKELPAHHHSFLGIAYDTLQMIFFESPIPFVDDWRLAPLFFGLPLLGLLVIAEGVVNLGRVLFQFRTHSREWQEMLAESFENHIVVAGLGNVGFRVVQQLSKAKENIVCIERDENSSFIPELKAFGVPVLIGDVRNRQILESAGIKKAKAFLAVTDDDLANIEAGLNAREFSPNIRIILRIFDQRLAQKIEGAFGVNSAFSTSALAAPVFAQAALSGNILSSFEFGGTLVSAFQLVVEPGGVMSGQTVNEVRQKHEVTVLMHQTNGKADWNPAPDVKLNDGDKLLVIADNDNLQTFITAEQSSCKVRR